VQQISAHQRPGDTGDWLGNARANTSASNAATAAGTNPGSNPDTSKRLGDKIADDDIETGGDQQGQVDRSAARVVVKGYFPRNATLAEFPK